MRNRKVLIIIGVCVILAVIGSAILLKRKDNKVQSYITDKSAIGIYHAWTIVFDKELTNEDIEAVAIEIKDSKGANVDCFWTISPNGKSIEVKPPMHGYVADQEYSLHIKAPISFTVNGEKNSEMTISFTPKIVYEDTKVVIEDENLEKEIREMIKKPQGDLYISDVESITMLIVNNREIKSIKGIEYLVNLREFYMDVNSVSDITPLAGLTYLQRLGLSYNKITDISVLKGMELKYLALAGNNITDYSPVEDIYDELQWKDFTLD
jgi:internalin A